MQFLILTENCFISDNCDPFSCDAITRLNRILEFDTDNSQDKRKIFAVKFNWAVVAALAWKNGNNINKLIIVFFMLTGKFQQATSIIDNCPFYFFVSEHFIQQV
ncbi:hypothetical protein AYY16_12330 [Morganella psychrotolerans]|nr:hypothetical protein AYY16_12330 [Morganella psychrotolerans]